MEKINSIVEKLISNSNKTFVEKEKLLLSRAVQTLLGNVCTGAEYAWKEKRIIIPSHACYLGAWNWDSAFHALATSRWDLTLALEQIDLFFDQMDEIGTLPDAIIANGEVWWGITKPPVWAWVLREIYTRTKSFDLCHYYKKLKQSVRFWVEKRKSGELFHYDASGYSERSRYLECCKFESGWDTSVRWDNGAQTLWAIDLNCYLVLTYRTLSEFAIELGLNSESEEWAREEKTLSNAINEVMWCEESGCYFDVEIESRLPTKIYSPASFMPLFAGIADENRAKRLAEVVLSDSKFYPLFPTVSYDNFEYTPTDYWRGPCWLNVAYFALKGFADYGYMDLVADFKNHLLTMCDQEVSGVFEYYDSKTGKGLGAKDFGWSATFIIEMILNL